MSSDVVEVKTFWFKCSANKFAKKNRKRGYSVRVHKNNWYLKGGRFWEAVVKEHLQ